jgi:hypothetical protein
MNKEKLKSLISNLEILLDELKTEVYPKPNPLQCEQISQYLTDYDEVFYDDDND